MRAGDGCSLNPGRCFATDQAKAWFESHVDLVLRGLELRPD
jgi:hypothetical protein